MPSSSLTAHVTSGSAVSRLLLWALVIAFACPVRVDFTIGPFTTISVVDVVLMLCAVYLVASFTTLNPLRAGPPVMLAAVLTPALLAFCSLSWAANSSLTTAAIVKYFYAALIYFVALQLAYDRDLKTLVRVCLVLLFGWLLGSLAMYLDMPGFRFFIPQSLSLSEGETFSLFASLYTRLGHPYLGQSNDYGPLLALLGFVLLACARIRRNRWVVAASWLAFFSSLLTFSRGLIVGLLVSLALYVWMGRIPMRRVASVTAATLLVLATLLLAASRFAVVLADREIEIADIVESRLSDVNATARIEGYIETLDLIAERPLLGYGAGFFDKTYTDAQKAVHNAFLEQWIYFGLLFGPLPIACYLAIAVYFFRARETSVFHEALACAWVFLLLSSQVETFFEATVPRAFIYFMLGLCVRPSLLAGPQVRLNSPRLLSDSSTFASSQERA